MTQLYGGYGVFQVLSLSSASYVDVKCIELTRHSQCVKFGSPAIPAGCNTGFPLDDYAQNGITTNNSTHDILLQDMWIHGFTSRGIIGPIGGLVTATRVDVAYNGGAGWDFDDGNSTPSINATLKAEGLIVEFSGCNQAYPGTGAASCYGQSTGGYGDGLGTAEGTCISFQVNNSIFRYNVQDGFDGLHNDGNTNCPSSITNSKSYGNGGQQFKWGPALTPMVFTNNLAVSACHRMAAPLTGQPSTYNANLQDFCRANDTITFSLGNSGSTLIDHNTVISYAPTVFDVECGASGCANSTLTISNNIVLGYDNPATYTGPSPGGPGAIFFSAVPTTVVRTNNDYFGMGHGFVPANTEQIADPKFVGEPILFTQESDLDVFNNFPVLSSASPLSGIGASANGGGTGAQITPTVTWSSLSSIVQGVALSSTQLNATASVPGTFVYSPSAGTVLPVGTSILSVAFTPTNTTAYTNANGTVTIVVTPQIVINPPPPSGCPTGQTQVTLSLGAASYTLCAISQ
jgi:hypothetical protein